VSRKTGMARLPEWTSKACPFGKDCRGRVARLPQVFGLSINHYFIKSCPFKNAILEYTIMT